MLIFKSFYKLSQMLLFWLFNSTMIFYALLGVEYNWNFQNILIVKASTT